MTCLGEGKIEDGQVLVVNDMCSLVLELGIPDRVKCVAGGVSSL